jgi:hypothetical protein
VSLGVIPVISTFVDSLSSELFLGGLLSGLGAFGVGLVVTLGWRGVRRLPRPAPIAAGLIVVGVLAASVGIPPVRRPAGRDPDTTEFFPLPAGTSGTVYVRVVDTDRSRDDPSLSSVLIDHIYIRSE